MIVILLVHALILWVLEFYPYPELFIYPYLTAHGFLPYFHILDQHFPGLMFFAVNFYTLGFSTPFAFKLLLISIVLIQSLMIFKITGSRLATIVYALWQPFFEGNQLWLDTFLGLFTLPAYYFSTQKKWSRVGLCLGLGVVFKQTLIPLVAFVGLVLLKRGNIKNLIRFSLAAVFPSILMLVYFQYLGVLNDFWFWTVRFNLGDYALGGRLAPTLGQLLKLALPIGMVVYVFAKNAQSRLITGWLVFSVLGGLARFGFIHLQPAMPFFSILVGVSILNKRILGVFFALSLILVGGFYLKQNNFLQTHFFDSETNKITDFIKQNTNPGGKIFLLGLNPHVYALTQTFPPGNIFVFQFPWFLQIAQPRVLQALRNDPPKLILFDPTSNIDGQWLINYGSDLIEYTRADYRQTQQIGTVQIYENRN